jgi:metal transporter CNNM
MSHIPSVWIWLGIIACVTLSALFSGLNLAIFSLSQLRLQIEADGGNKDAARVLDLRKNSNQVLATVIWGNVGTNVFLTLLSDSILAGLGAFFFSAIMITLFGEIAPQAYFSRNALRKTARFLPFVIFWRAALFFVARPTAMLLDWWLGVEGITYLHERDVRSLVARAAAGGGDIGKLEATGVQNFLDLDDLPVTEEGEPVHAQSIISLPLANGRCVLPTFNPSPDDPFLQRVNASGKKWVIVTDLSGEPAFVRSLPAPQFRGPTSTLSDSISCSYSSSRCGVVQEVTVAVRSRLPKGLASANSTFAGPIAWEGEGEKCLRWL